MKLLNELLHYVSIGIAQLTEVWHEMWDPTIKPRKGDKIMVLVVTVAVILLYRYSDLFVLGLALALLVFLFVKFVRRRHDRNYRKKYVIPSNQKEPERQTRVTEKHFR